MREWSLSQMLEPKVGIEPTTYALRMRCSTPELLRLVLHLGRKKQYKGPFQLVICFFAPFPQNSPPA